MKHADILVWCARKTDMYCKPLRRHVSGFCCLPILRLALQKLITNIESTNIRVCVYVCVERVRERERERGGEQPRRCSDERLTLPLHKHSVRDEENIPVQHSLQVLRSNSMHCYTTVCPHVQGGNPRAA